MVPGCRASMQSTCIDASDIMIALCMLVVNSEEFSTGSLLNTYMTDILGTPAKLLLHVSLG